MTANDPATQVRSTTTASGSRCGSAPGAPHRYRMVHETRAEYVLPLPATVPDMAGLLDTVRAALHAEGRPPSDARVHQGAGGELVVSYQVSTHRRTATAPAPRRKVVGFQ